MKTFHVLFLFYVIILKTEIFAINITLSLSHKLPVKLNESIVITCKISEVLKNVVLFIFRNDDMVSEGCTVFNKKLYGISCENKTEFKFEIKQMSWDDRAKWQCAYGDYSNFINLTDIYVSSNVSISITSIPSETMSSNLGPQSFPMKHETSVRLKGKGTNLYPYDLRKNITVNLICKSDCGYPEVYHTFNFKNSSNYSLELNKTFKFKTSICETKRNTSSAVSILKLNCWNLKLYGLINLTCSTFHSYNNGLKLKISDEKIFVLCPTDPIEWWKMTYGEMINTVIGSMIGFMMLMFLFLMLCRWKSYKHKNNYDSCQEDNGDSKMGRGYRV